MLIFCLHFISYLLAQRYAKYVHYVKCLLGNYAMRVEGKCKDKKYYI